MVFKVSKVYREFRVYKVLTGQQVLKVFKVMMVQ